MIILEKCKMQAILECSRMKHVIFITLPKFVKHNFSNTGPFYFIALFQCQVQVEMHVCGKCQ